MQKYTFYLSLFAFTFLNPAQGMEPKKVTLSPVEYNKICDKITPMAALASNYRNKLANPDKNIVFISQIPIFHPTTRDLINKFQPFHILQKKLKTKAKITLFYVLPSTGFIEKKVLTIKPANDTTEQLPKIITLRINENYVDPSECNNKEKASLMAYFHIHNNPQLSQKEFYEDSKNLAAFNKFHKGINQHQFLLAQYSY